MASPAKFFRKVAGKLFLRKNHHTARVSGGVRDRFTIVIVSWFISPIYGMYIPAGHPSTVDGSEI